tara:strand:+ start:277 stop:702 length:426 start_codon:yes stop_codon:yes gene_type:complete
MFKLLKNETTRQKVEFELPRDSDADVKKAQIFVTFKVNPRKIKRERDQAIAALARQAKNYIEGKEEELEVTTTDSENQYLTEDITNIEGVAGPGDDDDELEFTPELLEEILEADYVRDALMLVWHNVQNNKAFRKASKAKN